VIVAVAVVVAGMVVVVTTRFCVHVCVLMSVI
jgi:hypothetical protein